jgi:hypothetical protein
VTRYFYYLYNSENYREEEPEEEGDPLHIWDFNGYAGGVYMED